MSKLILYRDYMQLSAEHLSALEDCRNEAVEFPAAFEDTIYQELVFGGFIVYQQHLSDPDTASFELTPTGRAMLKLLGSTLG
jgi:hypothetical protein